MSLPPDMPRRARRAASEQDAPLPPIPVSDLAESMGATPTGATPTVQPQNSAAGSGHDEQQRPAMPDLGSGNAGPSLPRRSDLRQARDGAAEQNSTLPAAPLPTAVDELTSSIPRQQAESVQYAQPQQAQQHASYDFAPAQPAEPAQATESAPAPAAPPAQQQTTSAMPMAVRRSPESVAAEAVAQAHQQTQQQTQEGAAAASQEAFAPAAAPGVASFASPPAQPQAPQHPDQQPHHQANTAMPAAQPPSPAGPGGGQLDFEPATEYANSTPETVAPTAPYAFAQPAAQQGAQGGMPAPPSGPRRAPGFGEEKARRANGERELVMHEVMEAMIAAGASDLHITVGVRPMIRKHGNLVPLEDYAVLEADAVQEALYSIMTQRQRETFEKALELDFSYSMADKGRFRVNIYRQREALGAALRVIPSELKSLTELGVPEVVGGLAGLPRGLVLVTGPTGSGKSTTLAALVDLANQTRQDHIMTVEDPIEFVHEHKECVVNQREVGEDSQSFTAALKHALRQDVDIILVGEMRDLETISVALTAAETGHLVMGTLHTQDAPQTVERIVDVFPPEQQQQIRVMLAGTLQGIVAQTLCPTTDGKSRIAACEVLMVTPAVRNLIREGKVHQIPTAMQAGAKFGMQTMDMALAQLARSGKITMQTGLDKCHSEEEFKRLAS